MPELSGSDLLHEWRRLMDAVMASAASAASAGRPDVPHQLVEPMQRQLELVRELVERERRMQRQVTGQVLAPFDALFDLLEESGTMLQRQAEALEAAGRALEETAGLVKRQAELFERTVAAMRQPLELTRAVAMLERRPRGDRPRDDGTEHQAG